MNKVKYFTVTLFISLFLIASAFAEANSNDEFQIKNLNDEWELFLEKTPEQTFYLTDNHVPADFIVTVPNEWNPQVHEAGKSS